MSARRLCLMLTAAVCAAGCDFFGPDESLKDEIAPADSINIISVQSLKAKITVYSRASDPCWLYSRSTEAHTDSTITMKFYKLRRQQDACPQVITWIPIPVEITVAAAGSYTLKFYRSESSTLDTTIIF